MTIGDHINEIVEELDENPWEFCLRTRFREARSETFEWLFSSLFCKDPFAPPIEKYTNEETAGKDLNGIRHNVIKFLAHPRC